MLEVRPVFNFRIFFVGPDSASKTNAHTHRVTMVVT
jgi:hypothetical protein